MQPTLPMNIQTAKGAIGKMPNALGGKTAGMQIPGAVQGTGDFSSILSMLSGKAGQAQAIDAKAGEAMMGKMMEGELQMIELTPEQALEAKLQGGLTSPKAANLTLFSETAPQTENVGEALVTEKKGSVKNLVAKPELTTAQSENVDLQKILGTSEAKPVAQTQGQMAEVLAKHQGEGQVKKGMMNQMPVQKAEVALADNGDMLNLRQTLKNSKAQASNEYNKGQKPFDNNVIQFKKESSFEKEISKVDSETMKPLELLARESASTIQHAPREQQMTVALGGAAHTGKALDLSGAQNNAEVINKIVNYLEQNNIQNRDSLEVAVKHNTLGEFNIHVQKGNGVNDVNIQILTRSDAGHEFFAKNENILAKALTDSGIKVADLRVSTMGSEQMMSSKQGDSNSSGSSFGHSNSQNGQSYYNEKQQSHEDSRRRQELWEQFRERSLA